MSELIPILMVTVCAPLWIIFHYTTKKMEDRIVTLERILDIESPSWRQRHE